MDKPTYYAVIPAPVRYDNRLTGAARIFYGELSALTNKHNICWASNKYFVQLYECDEKTITRWIKELEDFGYIEVNVTPRKTGSGGRTRQICLLPLPKEDVPDKNVGYPRTKMSVTLPKFSPINGFTKPLNEGQPVLNNTSTNITRDTPPQDKSFGESSLREEESHYEPLDDQGEEIQPKWGRKPAKKETTSDSMKFLLHWSIERRGTPFINGKKQIKAFSAFKEAGITPDRAMQRWEEMERDKFWQKNGFDWLNVLNSFDKRP